MHKGNVLASLLSLALPSFSLPNLRAFSSDVLHTPHRAHQGSHTIRMLNPGSHWHTALAPLSVVSEFKKDYPTFSHSTLCTQRHQRHPGAAKSIAKQTQHWAVCSEHAAPLAPDGHSCAIDAAVSFSLLWCRACISISSGNRSVTFPDALLCTAHLLNFFFSCAGCSCLSKYM